MLLGYKYKLKPTDKQAHRLRSWIDMLRSNYNYNLAYRINCYQQRFKMGEYCDIKTKAVIRPLTCDVSSFVTATSDTGRYVSKNGKTISSKGIQQANLPVLKKVRPWFKDVDSTALQANIDNLDSAYQGFFKGKGFPKFKNKSNFKSLTIKNTSNAVVISGNQIRLGKLGWVKFHNSRSIPTGFIIKSVTVRLKADGFYISVKIEDKAGPNYIEPELKTVHSAIGVDMGITKLAHCSDGHQFNNPKFSTNKKTKHLMSVRQGRINRKKKGSNNRRKAGNKVGRLHQKIASQRNAYQWWVAKKIVRKANLVVVEDLNISAMKKRCKVKKDPSNPGKYLTNGQARKRGLNRSISDASWYSLTQKIKYLAEKQGKVFRRVNPRFTSQTCPECGHVHKSNRDKEKFICGECGYFNHADINAARNIRRRGIELIQSWSKEEPEIWFFKSVVPSDCREPGSRDASERPTPELTGVERRYPYIDSKESKEPGNSYVNTVKSVLKERLRYRKNT